jgi:hypothetical protein
MSVSVRGYAAERIRGCATNFGRLSAGTTPYYNVIYYGNVAQAAYGLLLILEITSVKLGA